MNASINGKEYSFEPGETILQVARRNGIFIPTLCHFQPLDHKPGTCRVCLAEVTDKNGHTEMMTTCNTPMEEGMRVNTRSMRVRDMQRLQVELIFADHDQDCGACARHGNCELQDLAEYVGLATNRFAPRMPSVRPHDDTMRGMVRDMTKCVRCLRCVEVCRKVQGVAALTVDGTGVGGAYESYDQNPGVLYLTKDPYTYKSASGSNGSYTQGEEVTNNVALRFQAATTGQEQTSWITALGSGDVDILELDYASETVLTMYESGKLLDLTWWVENYMPNYLNFVKELGVENLVTSTVNGERKYLQLYTFQENVYEYYYGYQYRKDWLLEYGKVFSEDGTVGEQTFAEAHPDWGWQTDENGSRTWVDGILFPSWYGLKYISDGSATGTGTFTFDQELYDYMHGEYASYSEQRATELEEGAFSSLERDFTTYHGQWAATLSDWEWLLDVMQAARAGLGYTQGYPMSMYQSGYISTGNLVSSFGGSGVEWQTDETSENVVFGADGPAFKTYVETMNEWYANGWIDPNFQTNEELFWRSDENTVRQGYVGLYLGMNDQLFDGMDMGTPTTEGIYVEGMPYPINDKYGTPEQQYVKPYTFYCMQPEVNSVMVTTDAEKNGKDLAAMFTLLDACYTEEFSVMKARGLSKEMLEASQDGVKELYADVGYPEGTTVYNPDPDGGKGEYYMVEGTPLTTEQEYYTTCKRMFGLEAFVALREQMDEHQVREYLWNYFTPSEYLTKSFYGQLTPDQYDIYEDKLAELRNALAVDIPKFIKGDSTRPLSSWDSWYQSLKKTCQVDQITNMLNNVYHSLNG